MNRARLLPLQLYRPDRLEAARNVVLRADRMSLIDESQRRAILTLAWQVLREDRDLRQRPRPLPTAEARVIDLSSAARLTGPHRSATPHRITLVQPDPSDPKDAA